MRLSQIYSDFITSTKKEVAEKSEKIFNLERSDRRGFGESFPRAPQGLSRSDWGLEAKRTQCEATEGVSGNPFPVPLRGCHVVTGGWRQKKKERMTKEFPFGHPLIYFQE